jgi:hypothetical protein
MADGDNGGPMKTIITVWPDSDSWMVSEDRVIK